jgi:Ala-tRNA(Pro) deacylase
MNGKDRLESYLRDNKISFQIHHHPQAFTAQELAAVEHVPGREFAKVVLVSGGSGMAMAVVPAPKQVDLDKASRILGADKARIATEEEFSSMFSDCDTGAMPPLGNGTLYDTPVYVDEALARQGTIVFNACTHTDALHMSYTDFERLVKPEVVDLTAT